MYVKIIFFHDVLINLFCIDFKQANAKNEQQICTFCPVNALDLIFCNDLAIGAYFFIYWLYSLERWAFLKLTPKLPRVLSLIFKRPFEGIVCSSQKCFLHIYLETRLLTISILLSKVSQWRIPFEIVALLILCTVSQPLCCHFIFPYWQICGK